jgi:hypothetical protein
MSMWSQYGRLAAKDDPINDGVTLHAVIPHTNLRVMGCHAATASFSEVPADAATPTLLSLNRPQTQRLLDDLWAAGFRPSKEPTNDYREIVFRLLAIMEGQCRPVAVQ